MTFSKILDLSYKNRSKDVRDIREHKVLTRGDGTSPKKYYVYPYFRTKPNMQMERLYD